MPRPQEGQVIDLLLASRRLLDPGTLPHPEHVVDHPSARVVLKAIWASAMATLTTGTNSVSPDLVQVLQAVKELDERLLLDQIASQDRALQRVRAALAMLGETKSCSTLLDTAATTACSLGFDRSIVSRVADSLWIPERVHVDKDEMWAREILAVGRSTPQQLNGSIVETEMVRRRTSILVDQVQDRPGVHKEIAEASMSRSYAAAPIVVHGVVAGFVHVDCYYQQRNVDQLDRQILTMFTEGLGQALTRTMVLDELGTIRRDVDELSRRLAAVRDEGDSRVLWGHEDDVDEAPGDIRRSRPSGGVDHFLRSAPVDPTLTRREVEVLRLMAAGDTNSRIASRLVISEGTVKSHVKHILRKLGVANRAEAVSHWLRSRHDVQRERVQAGDGRR
ncbi:LuxR C-terminal-related transcriptional regulator [Pseudonocardia sp. KRD291]|uniref:helix-turn-helix transcriptional regulator n=1 Tax=Pseudonocardia sp. KRD291 TaxID=2792007 RepID=UPI001C5C7AD9|nr:LuxR C-terminal-related transcriptional regulator [Pseudonocardia sp. KRD291]MBW0101159.1 LuxR family transcriptional regulator [Pseudonocardia sp. KRD291]